LGHLSEPRVVISGIERIEGRKSYEERKPKLIKLAKRLAHGNRKKHLSLRGIAAELAAQGFVKATGKPFSADQVSRLLHTRKW
jgi:hypothetical protein